MSLENTTKYRWQELAIISVGFIIRTYVMFLLFIDGIILINRGHINTLVYNRIMGFILVSLSIYLLNNLLNKKISASSCDAWATVLIFIIILQVLAFITRQESTLIINIINIIKSPLYYIN